MTQCRFFQVSLFLPFVLWCLYLLIVSLVKGLGISFIAEKVIESFHVFVPYFLFAAVIWRWVCQKPYKQLVLISLVVPVIWGVFFTFAHALQLYFMQHTVEKWSILAIMLFWSTIVAYIAEALPLLILTVFKGDFRTDCLSTPQEG